MKPDRSEGLSHEYKRNGITSLLASWEVHSGQVRAEPIHRNNSATFIRLLRQFLHAYPAPQQENPGLGRQAKRLHLTVTPSHARWLNQIEIWFGILTRKVIRRGTSNLEPNSCSDSRASSKATTSRPGLFNGLTRAIRAIRARVKAK